MPIDLLNFVRKWNAATLTERSAATQHFRDLCEALEVEHPTQSDEIGASYTYEKRVTKAGTGEQGFADVWKRGFFAWEYKSKGGDLKKAYRQLNEYHEALENPPLLVVCDFVRFEVHTKFENLPSRTYAFTLDDLLVAKDTATSAIPPLEVLRYVFGDYNQLRPGVAAIRVTKAAASDFLRLAQRIELERVAAPDRPSKEDIAHFLMRLVFCLFADSVGLLPNHTFRTLVTNDRHSPISFNRKLPFLFQAMSEEHSFFGAENIPYFNGGLFSDNRTIQLDHADLGILNSASQHDWSHIEPVIFGTLFERSLDEAKRSMIGAHYTSSEDILLLIEPVVMDPLKRRWEIVKQSVLDALAEESALSAEGKSRSNAGLNTESTSHSTSVLSAESTSHSTSVLSAEGASHTSPGQSPGLDHTPQPGGLKARPIISPRRPAPALQLNRPALTLLQDWAAELTRIRILDPACGSGNFLYIALKRLLDLWHEARVFGLSHGLTLSLDPIPHPGQLFGIEIDFYAHEIASIVVWIGFLQWKHDHGVKETHSPLLRKLTNIEHADAILRYDAEGKPYEPTWPEVDFIVGNPPFLGGNRVRKELGNEYLDALFNLYEGRVEKLSDLVCYWFEKSRESLMRHRSERVGLLATQGIRGGANRNTLKRIKETGDIFFAISDREWSLDGAVVHISMVGFDAGQETRKMLDGEPIEEIFSNLTGGLDTTIAEVLPENLGICFMGVSPKGPFDISTEVAEKMMTAPLNVNGHPNSDVVRRVMSGTDIGGRSREVWTIDFGTNASEKLAAMYEMPFSYLRHHVYPIRQKNNRESYKRKWWLFGEPRPVMRRALKGKARYIATPATAKHRVFAWIESGVLCNQGTLVFAREDDYFFGVLHSSIHELWARLRAHNFVR